MHTQRVRLRGGAQGADPSLYEKARLHFIEAMSKTGFMAELAYAIGLCHYQQKQYGPALKLIAEIIERGVPRGHRHNPGAPQRETPPAGKRALCVMALCVIALCVMALCVMGRPAPGAPRV